MLRRLLAWTALALGSCAAVGSSLDAWFDSIANPNPARQGQTQFGKRYKEWSFFYVEAGQRAGLKARGTYSQDKQVGPWTYWHPNGQESWRGTFDKERGLQGPTSFWRPDGSLAVEGEFLGGLEHGDWVFHGPQGHRSSAGRFELGRREGSWSFWDAESGALVAQGAFRADEPEGDWSFFAPDGSARPGQDPALLESFAARPKIPLRSQPEITDVERTFLPVLYSFQRDGADNSEDVAEALELDEFLGGSDGVGGGRYAAGPTKLKERDYLLSEALEGRPLADVVPNLDEFEVPTGDGDWLRLGDVVGKRKLLLVVLRGMQREVCIYCQLQTAALCELYPSFEALDTEVLVVYPGDDNRRAAFLEQYSDFVDEFNRGIEEYKRQVAERFPDDLERIDKAIPSGLKIGLDARLELTEALGVSDDLARPTVVLCDAEGIIRYAYVGAAGFPEDRPAVRTLLEKVGEF